MQDTALDASARSDGKTDAIVRAARETFLAKGFDAASMDQIALTAGVSKRTVYNRFRSKEELFAAAIMESCKNLLPVNIEDIEASLPPVALIRQLSHTVVKGLFHPEALALRRIAAFEAARTPSLGKAYLKHGPEWMVDMFTPIMQRFADKGVFKVKDAKEAIWQLGVLITEPLHTKLLMGVEPEDLDRAIDKQIDDGIAAFMVLHAP